MNNSPSFSCPICEKGTFRKELRDYSVRLGDGENITLPNIAQNVCDFCGEIAVTEEGAEQIDAAIELYNEALSTTDLETIRGMFAVTQDEMSSIIGCGAKTYHRWERGIQFPSRSMGYYLRVLYHFPHVFDWLKRKGWIVAPVNRVYLRKEDIEDVFPDLHRRISSQRTKSTNPDLSDNRNYARVLYGLLRP